MASVAEIIARLQEHPRFRMHAVLIVLQLALAVWVTIDAGRYPDPGFEVGSSDDGLVVTAVTRPDPPPDYPRVGDQVLGVDERAVDTRTEFWDAIANQSGDVEVTLQRFGIRYDLNLTMASFDHGGRPAGVKPDDRPVGMACQESGYVELAAVDIEGLTHLVRQRAGKNGLLVSFERPTDEVRGHILLEQTPLNFEAGGVLLLGAALIFVILLLSARTGFVRTEDSRDVYLSWLVLLCSLAGVSLSGGPALAGSPILFAAGILGLALFKPLDLEFHLRSQAGWAPIDLFTRIALYVAPAIFAAQVLFYTLSNIQMWWGADVEIVAEGRMDTMWLMVAATAGALIAIDAGLVLLRHYRRGEDDTYTATASRIGLGFSLLFVAAAIYLYVTLNDLQWAGYALSAALGAQLLGDLVSLIDLPRSYWRGDVGALSPSIVAEFLHPVARLFPKQDVVIVVARSAFDQERVGLRMARDENGALLPRLERFLVSSDWVEFMDILEAEELSIPVFGDRPDLDPIGNMPQKLGISVAWPLARNLAGTGASFSLFIGRSEDADPLLPLPATSELPLEDLRELTDDFESTAPAALIQALDVAPITVRHINPPSDGDVPTAKPAARVEAVGATPEPFRADREPAHASGEDDVVSLQAQLIAMSAELQRLHPVDEIDPTHAQQSAATEVSEEASPILLLGESGVGKTLVGVLAHRNLELGPFVRLSAAEVPETVLALELFGNDNRPGRLTAAQGGTLIIEGADRLPPGLLDELLDEVEQLPPELAPRVLLSVDTRRDAATRTAIPAELEDLADRAGAEVVLVPPLREHPDDIPNLVSFFLHRSAMRHGKLVTEVTDDALEQLRQYEWPGNQRELREVIERAVLVCDTRELTVNDLSLNFGATETEGIEGSEETASILRAVENERDHLAAERASIESARQELEEARAEIDDARRELAAAQEASATPVSGDRMDLDAVFGRSHEEVERQHLAFALERAGGNKSLAARELDLKRSTFINKLKKYNLG